MGISRSLVGKITRGEAWPEIPAATDEWGSGQVVDPLPQYCRDHKVSDQAEVASLIDQWIENWIVARAQAAGVFNYERLARHGEVKAGSRRKRNCGPKCAERTIEQPGYDCLEDPIGNCDDSSRWAYVRLLPSVAGGMVSPTGHDLDEGKEWVARARHLTFTPSRDLSPEHMASIDFEIALKLLEPEDRWALAAWYKNGELYPAEAGRKLLAARPVDRAA